MYTNTLKSINSSLVSGCLETSLSIKANGQLFCDLKRDQRQEQITGRKVLLRGRKNWSEK